MKKSKEQQVVEDWKAYNKRMKASRVPPMSLEEYKNWINGTTSKPKKNSVSKREPTISKPTWANTTEHIASVKPGSYIPVKSTMVERARLGLESPEVADEIIKKSKRIGLMYSKGTYGYITDETDVKDLGKKNPTMR